MTVSTTPPVTGVEVPQEDADAITAFVAEVQRAQQAALAEEFLTGFRPDALWTTAHGRRLIGFDTIADFTRKVLPPTADSDITATYEVEHILFIREDIAAVKIRQRPVTRDGRFLDEVFHGHPDPSALVEAHPDGLPGSPLYILAKDGGVWRIAAAQNTVVVDPGSLAAAP
ncbi:SgcJ/EcaC family oxidoreductase [Streptomyces sp. NPDC046887]|uniref:SgcJ/EcaC family oxidoreductase n=1 Tax=Streptomyces sp. NPDC046887 TaxID=3155472 RepID=UPI0033E822EF